MSEEPEAILTGVLPDGQQILVTVWSDAGEVAFRPDSNTGWSHPPVPLTREGM